MGAEWWGLIGALLAMGLTIISGLIMIKHMTKKKK